MNNSVSIRLFDFLISLSEALDLFSPLLAQHQIKTAFIAWEIGKKIELNKKDLTDLIIASLLHDIGALNPEEKIDLHQSEYYKNINLHCDFGEKLLKGFHLFKRPALLVKYHHTKWCEIKTISDGDTAKLSQILFLADTIERFIQRNIHILNQYNEITCEIKSMGNEHFSREVIEAYLEIEKVESFWLDAVSPFTIEKIKNNSPGKDILIQESEFLPLSKLIGNIIDFRSNFTATHSTGVSTASALIAELYGFSDSEVKLMKVAGNLHDIGKLSISNEILEKKGKLTSDESAIMKQHTYFTYTILKRCGLPQKMIEWAAFHHEKLDGSGYPFHLTEKDLSMGSKILAVADVFTALAEDRPYRKSLKKEKILSILQKKEKENFLDKDIVDILWSNYESIKIKTIESQLQAKYVYNDNVSYV